MTSWIGAGNLDARLGHIALILLGLWILLGTWFAWKAHRAPVGMEQCAGKAKGGGRRG